jgi:putative flippase GtrA
MEMLSQIPESAWRVIRFLISGSTSAALSIGTLYLFNTIFGFWYIVASIAGFFVGFVVSFTLHKYWTFRDHRQDQDVMRAQFARYIAVVLFNLVVNTILVYVFVEYVKTPPVIAQALSAIIIACESFFAYRFLVFHQSAVDIP